MACATSQVAQASHRALAEDQLRVQAPFGVRRASLLLQTREHPEPRSRLQGVSSDRRETLVRLQYPPEDVPPVADEKIVARLYLFAQSRSRGGPSDVKVPYSVPE